VGSLLVLSVGSSPGPGGIFRFSSSGSRAALSPLFFCLSFLLCFVQDRDVGGGASADREIHNLRRQRGHL